MAVSVMLRHAYHSTKIRILEMGLVYRFGPGRPLARTDIEDQSDSVAVHRNLIMNLVRCTDAAKEYLDCFLAVDANDYHSLPLEEWLRAILAPFVLYRLCVGLREVPEWSTETARSTVDLEYYLNQILGRLKAMEPNTSVDRTLEADDLYALLPAIFENVMRSFIAARDGVCDSLDGIRAHQDLGISQRKSANTNAQSNITPHNQRIRCPATSDLPTATSFDLWNDPQIMAAQGHELATDIQGLENDTFWSHFMVNDFPINALPDF